MPIKIPVYEQQIIPRTFGTTPHARPLPHFDTGAEFKAIGQALNNISDLQLRVDQAERSMRLTTANAQAASAIDELLFSLENDTDYDTQLERYQQGVQQIEAQTRVYLGEDERLYQTFQNDFATTALKGSLNVRRGIIKGKISHYKAQLDDALHNYSQLATGEDLAIDEDMRNGGLIAIEDAEASGILSPEEAQAKRQTYHDDITAAQIRFDINSNPDLVIRRLQTGEYKNLTGEQRNIWLERALARSEALERKRVADEDRAFRLLERAERDAEEATAREGDKRLQSNQLTTDWIEANYDRLAATDRRYYYRELKSDEAVTTDIFTYTDLRTRAARGEDVRTEARQALHNRHIRLSDYDKINTAVESNSVAGVSWYQRGERFIDRALRVSEINPDPAAAQRQANALDDWQQWAVRNKEASDEQAGRAFRQLVNEYALINWQDMLISKRQPAYLVGKRTDPDSIDIEGTEQATVEALQKGEISLEEYERQAMLIQEMRDALDAIRRAQGQF